MNKRNFFLLVLFFAGIIYFFKLGSLPLLDPDEPRYAEAAREMIESGDWINPQFNYQNRWDKPVFFYWLILGSYQIFGVSEWSARLPSALVGLLSLLAVFLWVSKRQNSRAGFFSALILATNVEFSIVGRLSITDMTLCFFQLLTLIILFESYWTGKTRWIFISYITAAIAFLTKGPVGILIPAGIFFIYLLFTGGLGFLKKARLFQGLLIVSAIGLPWYLIEGFLYKDFFQYFFILHNVKRFATSELRHTEPLYYYFLVLVAGFFPWAFFLPRLFVKSIKSLFRDPFSRFLSIWIIVDLAFFTFSKAKLPTYILLVYPPLSILVAKFWSGLLENREARTPRFECVLMAVVAVSGIITGMFFWNKIFPGQLWSYAWATIPAMILFLALGMVSIKGNPLKVFYGVVMAYTVSFLFIIHFLGPFLGEARSMKNLAYEIKLRAGEESEIGAFQYFKPSLVYYLKRSVEHLRTLEDLESFINGSSSIFCVMREENYKNLMNMPIYNRLFLLQRVQGKVLVSNKDRSSS